MKPAIILCIFCIPFLLRGQNQIGPEIGQFPSDMRFPDLINWPSPDTPTLHSLRGKVVILDCWATWCLPCIKAMPRLDSLQALLGDQVQIITVTRESRLAIDKFLGNRKKAIGTSIRVPILVDDTTVSTYFPHTFLPHVIWINKDGKVVAITDDEKVNAENLRKLIYQDSLQVAVKKDRTFLHFDYDKPMEIVNGTRGTSSVCGSVLTRYQPGLYGGCQIYRNRIFAFNYPKYYLFKLAYGGALRSLGLSPSIGFPDNRTLLEFSADSLNIMRPKGDIEAGYKWQSINSFCYDLTLPGYDGSRVFDTASQPQIYTRMQTDLALYFPDIKARIEKRSVKCLVLTKGKRPDMLKTSGAPSDFEQNSFAIEATNIPFADFVSQLKDVYLQFDPRPFIDETGYSGWVDIKLTANMLNPSSVASALRKYDLNLAEQTRTIEMLVLSDK